jgi:hypothetical protein
MIDDSWGILLQILQIIWGNFKRISTYSKRRYFNRQWKEQEISWRLKGFVGYDAVPCVEFPMCRRIVAPSFSGSSSTSFSSFQNPKDKIAKIWNVAKRHSITSQKTATPLREPQISQKISYYFGWPEMPAQTQNMSSRGFQAKCETRQEMYV